MMASTSQSSGGESALRLVARAPTGPEYARLRAAVGWRPIADEAARRGLEAALYSVCLVDGEAVVGCGRVVGDGGVYFYLQDVIVLEPYQGRGWGRAITRALLEYVDKVAPANAFVGLMAASGVAPFYEPFGFAVRPQDRPGMFRIQR